jgi:hypothetical protein
MYYEIMTFNYDQAVWAAAESTADGGSSLFIVNSNLDVKTLSEKFPLKMGVAIPVEITEESNVEMHKIEDFIQLQLEDKGIHVISITDMENGFKEFLSHVVNGFDFESFHKLLKEKFLNFEIQMYGETDPNWVFYTDIASTLKADK